MANISKIYPNMQPIPMDESQNVFIDKINNELYPSLDHSLMSAESVEIDIDDLSEIPEGKIRIISDNARFECFFHKGKKDKFFIIFGGARTKNNNKRKIPMFSRWSYYNYCDYSLLSIEDPMYYDNDDLLLGWFYGTKNINYRQTAARIADKLIKHLNIKKENVCLMGSSGGGTVAIHTAALLGYGTAVAINCQLNFEYETGNNSLHHFAEKTGIDIFQKDKFYRNDLVSVMQKTPDVNYIIIENIKSSWDYEDHLKYLCHRLDITPDYGLNIFGNICLYLYLADSFSPHTAFENKPLFHAIDFLTDIVRDKEVEKYKSLYRLFAEFWKSIYDLKKSDVISEICEINSKFLCRNIDYDVKEIFDIEILPKDANYNYHSLCDISAMTLYTVEMFDVSSDSGLDKYDICVFDFTAKKTIVKKTVKIDAPDIFSFCTGKELGKCMVLIYAGEQGKTKRNSLFISKVKIGKTDNSSNEQGG